MQLTVVHCVCGQTIFASRSIPSALGIMDSVEDFFRKNYTLSFRLVFQKLRRWKKLGTLHLKNRNYHVNIDQWINIRNNPIHITVWEVGWLLQMKIREERITNLYKSNNAHDTKKQEMGLFAVSSLLQLSLINFATAITRWCLTQSTHGRSKVFQELEFKFLCFFCVRHMNHSFNWKRISSFIENGQIPRRNIFLSFFS